MEGETTKAIRRMWYQVQERIDCLFGRCDYYRHYLPYGPGLSHRGYHGASRACIAAQTQAMAWWDAHEPCPDLARGVSCSHTNPHDAAADRLERVVRA